MRTALLFTSLLSSCSPGDQFMNNTFHACAPLVIAAPDDATADELAGIDLGLEMWNRAASTRLSRMPRPGAAVLPIRYVVSAEFFFGTYLDEEATVVLNRLGGSLQERAVVVAHEIGHAFGLWHEEDCDSVMNPGNLDIAPNSRDVDVLSARWGTCPKQAFLTLPPR